MSETEPSNAKLVKLPYMLLDHFIVSVSGGINSPLREI